MKKIKFFGIIGFISFLVIGVFFLTNKTLNTAGYDFLLKNFNSQKANKDIAIIGMDEASILYVNSKVWDRKIFADLLIFIAKEKPKAVVLDILFVDKGSVKEDRAMVSALNELKEKKIPVILANNINNTHDITSPIYEGKAGFVNVLQSPDDGITRKSLMYHTYGDIRYENIALETVKAIGNTEIPNEKFLNIYFPSDKYEKYSILPYLLKIYENKNMLSEYYSDYLLTDKIVIIGTIYSGDNDSHVTPTGSIYGVELVAAQIQTILNKSYIFDVPPSILWLIMVLVMALLFYGSLKFSKKIQVIIIIGIVLFVAGLSLILFKSGYYFPLFPVLIGVTLFFGILITSQFSWENREFRVIRNDLQNGMIEKKVDYKDLTDFADEYGISKREKEVLALTLRGKGTKEIADKLYIQRDTVNFHKKNLAIKFGFESIKMYDFIKFFNNHLKSPK